MVCFFFVHFMGSVVVFEVEHVHHGDAGHHHDIAGHNHNDSGHHEHAPLPGTDGDSEDDGSPLPSHSHPLSIDIAAATIFSGFVKLAANMAVPVRDLRLENFSWPEGPSFELIKPPQLVLRGTLSRIRSALSV